jgi:anti-sigma B factor antagonist
MTTQQRPPIDKISIVDKIKENDFFRDSSISDLELDDLKLNVVHLMEGELLYRLGDSAESIYLIIEGEIDLIKKQSFGKTQPLLAKNKFLGHEEFFIGTERNSIAIALRDSTIVELSKENIEILLSHHDSILDNIKNTLPDLNSKSISKFEYIFKETRDQSEKLASVFSKAPRVTNNLESAHSITKEVSFVHKDSILTDYEIEPVKDEIIKNIDDYLSRLEEEKYGMQSLVSDYEISNRKLQNEIEELKVHEQRARDLVNEKNEILSGQNFKIVNLEKEAEKFKELKAEYLRKIELITEQNSKDKTRITDLEIELEENKKILPNLEATKLLLSQEADNQTQVINEQNTKLNNLEGKIISLTQESASKEKSIEELQWDLKNKNLLISEHNDSVNKAKTKIDNLIITLGTKEGTIKDLSVKIGELQTKLDNQNKSEKNKNEQIFNQSNRISEYEQILKDYKNELSIKIDTINKFNTEIRELSEEVKQKNSAICQQEKIIIELNSLSKDLEQKSRSLELKLKEYSDIIKENEGLKNTLEKKNKTIKDCDDLIAQLRTQLSGSSDLQNEFNELTIKHTSVSDAYNDLINENTRLNEKIENLELGIAVSKNEFNNISKEGSYTNGPELVEERYKSIIIEKDKTIKELREEHEAIKLFKSAQIKTLNSKKSDYEKEIRKRDIQITDLMRQIKHIQNASEEKNLLENQQGEIIEKQLQRIVQLELLINDANVKFDDSMDIKNENVLELSALNSNTIEQAQSKENYEVLSKADLITSKYANTSLPSESFEYWQYSDVHIVNVNLTRATMDSVASFKKLLQEIIGAEKFKIVVNLSKCEFIDSSIVGVLVHSNKKVTPMGGDLRLACLNSAVYSMMELTRMHRIFESFPTVEAAVASFDR